MAQDIWDLIQERAVYKGTREELALALSTTEGSALSPESLEPKIVELVRFLSPLVAGLKIVQSNGKTHEFNDRTAIPSANFEGEKAVTTDSQSTYNRRTAPLKIIRAKGGVTGFQQASSKSFVNSYANEVLGAAQAMAYAMEFGVMWGNLAADQYQYDGLDTKIITNRVDVAGVVKLSDLDDMLDPIIGKGPINRGDMAFFMSPMMHSKINTLQSEVRKSITKVMYAGGIEMTSYRDIPIVDTSFCRPTSKMGVIAVANSATAGNLVGGQTYRWRVAAVTKYGEQWASTAVTHTLGGGNTSVDITFTAVAGAELYKVYRTLQAGAASSEVFSKRNAAKTYDGAGTIGAAVVSINDGTLDASLGTDKPLDQDDKDEVIFLLNMNQDISLEIASLLNEQGEKVKNLIQMLPLARTIDQEQFLLLSYQALVYKGDIFNALSRRLRIS